jgi:hypothetical protein
MAKGSHRRPEKGKNKSVKISDEVKDLQRIKDREKSSRKSKNLVRQMQGKKWSEDEYDEDMEDKLI